MSAKNELRPTRATARRGRPLKGRVAAPADKSVSHRALLFAAAAEGTTTVHGLSDGADVAATRRAVEALGCVSSSAANGALIIESPGLKALASPDRPLDFGNSGTGARLAMGLVAGAGATASFIGDASLSGRPMGRVLEPLARMGAAAVARDGGRLPLTLSGPATTRGGRFEPAVASAQVKSAILFAGLGAERAVTILEPRATRDHTERMAGAFGVRVEREVSANGSVWVRLAPGTPIKGAAVRVIGDPSSAAFIAAGALATPGSEVVIENVATNPGRFGFFEALRAMGAPVRVEDEGANGEEPTARLTVTHSDLDAIDTAPGAAPAMIDEFPILSVLCAFARGTSRLRGLAELRVKESDRFAAIVDGLTACGVRAWAEDDDILIEGRGGPPAGGALVETHGDHRIAMSFLVLGLASANPVTVTEPAMIATSWPGFAATFRDLGADISERAEAS